MSLFISGKKLKLIFKIFEECLKDIGQDSDKTLHFESPEILGKFQTLPHWSKEYFWNIVRVVYPNAKF